jgi:hypothetical protein
MDAQFDKADTDHDRTLDANELAQLSNLFRGFSSKLPQNRHPERSASQILSRDTALVARSRRTSAVLILPMLLGAFQPTSPHRAGANSKTLHTAGDGRRLQCMKRCTHDHPVRIATDPVVGFRWSKRSEQHGQNKHRRGPSTPRHKGCVSRDKSVRRCAQDDDSVGV